MLDLKSLDIKAKAEVGARLFFDHPVEEGVKLDVFMDVLGRDSEKYKTLQKENQLKRMNAKITSKKAFTIEDLNDMEEDDIELLTSMVIGFGDKDEKGEILEYVILEGKELKYSKKNVTKLLTTFPWMKEQVQKFLWDRANFL